MPPEFPAMTAAPQVPGTPAATAHVQEDDAVIVIPAAATAPWTVARPVASRTALAHMFSTVGIGDGDGVGDGGGTYLTCLPHPEVVLERTLPDVRAANALAIARARRRLRRASSAPTETCMLDVKIGRQCHQRHHGAAPGSMRLNNVASHAPASAVLALHPIAGDESHKQARPVWDSLPAHGQGAQILAASHGLAQPPWRVLCSPGTPPRRMVQGRQGQHPTPEPHSQYNLLTKSASV